MTTEIDDMKWRNWKICAQLQTRHFCALLAILLHCSWLNSHVAKTSCNGVQNPWGFHGDISIYPCGQNILLSSGWSGYLFSIGSKGQPTLQMQQTKAERGAHTTLFLALLGDHVPWGCDWTAAIWLLLLSGLQNLQVEWTQVIQPKMMFCPLQ